MRTFNLAAAVLAFLVLVLPASAAQDSLPPNNWQKVGPKEHAEKSLKHMLKGDIDGAFKVLFGKNHTKEQMEKLKFEFYRVFKKNGKPRGYESILKQKAGSSLLRYRYLLLFKSQPVMLEYYYYKRPEGWALKTFHFSVKVKEIFKQ